MEPKDGAKTLAQAMNDVTHSPAFNNEGLQVLAQALSQMATRLEPKDAAPAATTLIQFMKEMKDPIVLAWLAQGLSLLAARMEPDDTATVTALAATILVSRMKSDNDIATAHLQQGLSAVLCPAALTGNRSTAAASIVAFPAATGHALPSFTLLIAVAESPSPCPLSTQQLVELLKMPTCIGKIQRVVLDQLGNRYRCRFANVWEFVHYAEEHKLDLDLTSPPKGL
jgi:hypothetical protein